MLHHHHILYKKIRVALESRTLIWVPVLLTFTSIIIIYNQCTTEKATSRGGGGQKRKKKERKKVLL